MPTKDAEKIEQAAVHRRKANKGDTGNKATAY